MKFCEYCNPQKNPAIQFWNGKPICFKHLQEEKRKIRENPPTANDVRDTLPKSGSNVIDLRRRAWFANTSTKIQRILNALSSAGEWRTARDISQILAYDMSPREISHLLIPFVVNGTVERDLPKCSCPKCQGKRFHSNIARYKVKYNVQ